MYMLARRWVWERRAPENKKTLAITAGSRARAQLCRRRRRRLGGHPGPRSSFTRNLQDDAEKRFRRNFRKHGKR